MITSITGNFTKNFTNEFTLCPCKVKVGFRVFKFLMKIACKTKYDIKMLDKRIFNFQRQKAHRTLSLLLFSSVVINVFLLPTGFPFWGSSKYKPVPGFAVKCFWTKLGF